MDLAEKYSGYKDATGYCPLHIPPPDTGIPTLRYRGVREHKRTVVVNQLTISEVVFHNIFNYLQNFSSMF